ncbi:MAG: hypothetical protein TR69_WS6001001036 [candidate division WS6 bacterium OLB20]|uniref:Uncharacterized protein n=1 Tax=candidate division WS6 bacterium OLB20 TaxID=1617426 RepID=A0A136LZC3_9BACT|nr:MAG: hypothetical protein TR69_WS6001001036 [candidate division WS6 bacterium OLB20]
MVMEYLFGKHPTPLQLWGTVLMALLTVILSVALLQSFTVSSVALVLLAIAAADLGGGIASNFTEETRRFYHGKKKAAA